LCNKLTEPARKRNKEDRNKHNGEENVEKMMGRTLIAFGAAHVSSVGFGYAHAPQKRFRHRLQFVHNCKVTLIDEWCTSKILSKFDIDKEKEKTASIKGKITLLSSSLLS